MNTLLLERSYFADLTHFSEDIINQLTEKIKDKDQIKSGDSFIVSMKDRKNLEIDSKNLEIDSKNLEIKFYKTYSKRGRDFLKKSSPKLSKNVSALFFPIPSKKASGTVEIYINHAKTYYYKDRDSIEIVNNRLPKFLKDILRHEITHAHDDVMSHFADTKPSRKDPDTFNQYLNSDEEVNAYFNEFLAAELNENKVVQYHIYMGDVNAAVRILLSKLEFNPYIQRMSEKNKKWVIKTIHTTIDNLVQKHAIPE